MYARKRDIFKVVNNNIINNTINRNVNGNHSSYDLR